MAAATLDMVQNPYNTGEIWITDGMFRRHVTWSEYQARAYYGATAGSISTEWFNSLPVAGA